MKELLYDEEFVVCEDFDLWVRALRHTKAANLPIELLTYRWHGTNTSIIKQRLILKSFIHIFSKNFDYYNISYDSKDLFIHSMIVLGYARRCDKVSVKSDQITNWFSKLKTSTSNVLNENFEKDDYLQYINDLEKLTLNSLNNPLCGLNKNKKSCA